MLRSLSLLLLCFVGTFNAAPAPNNAQAIQPRNEQKIVGGAEVSPPFRYPWMVRTLPVRNGNTYLCGGSLVAPNWVLTAAHCTEGITAASVLLHRHDLREDEEDEDGVTATVKRAIIHPQYNENTLLFDYALWELTESFDYDVVPLDFEAAGFTVGGDSIVIGWGDTIEDGNQSPVLKQATIKIFDFQDCSDYYSGTNSQFQVCAGIQAGGTDSCQGDSGGPLVVSKNGRLVQIGVVSYGVGCARQNVPGVYARVSGIKDWMSTYMTFPEAGNSSASWTGPSAAFLLIGLLTHMLRM